MAKVNDSTSRPPQRVVELVVNLDDVTGELAGHLIEQLIELGALDAWATPITMKKGRPALMLSALVREEDRELLAHQMLQMTGSFGLRYRQWDRLILDRAWHDRPTRLGTISLKAGSLNGQTLTVKPEHDALIALANEANVPLIQAQRIALAAADELLVELRLSEGAGT